MRPMFRPAFAALAVMGLMACDPSPSGGPNSDATFESFDGVTIAYTDRGGSDAPAVLLLHGLTGSAETNFGATGIRDALIADGFRIIAPDLRGHAGSSLPNIATNWPEDAMARDQAALLDHLKVEPVAVVGYSMGALVALRWATLDGDPNAMLLGGMGDKTAVIGDRTRHDGIAALLAHVRDGGDGLMADRVRVMLDASSSDADSVLGSLRRRMSVSQAEISAMDWPVLVLNGDADFDNGDGASLAAMFPNGAFKTLPGDHLTVLRTSAYAEAVADWLSETVDP